MSALVLRAPARILSDPRELHGATLEVAGAERNPADVVGEEGAVSADACELAIELGRALEARVQSVLVVIEQRGEPVQLFDRACQRRARPTEQVGQRRRSIVKRGDCLTNGIAV